MFLRPGSPVLEEVGSGSVNSNPCLPSSLLASLTFPAVGEPELWIQDD